MGFGAAEPFIRLGLFAGVFLAMAAAELWSPRLERPALSGALKSRRWRTNLALVVLSSIVLRIVFPAGAVGIALIAEAHGWGLMRMAGLHGLPAGVLAFVILDLAIWAFHVASHKVPLLWRLHRVHHADPGFDVTTGLRFHPFEIVVSMAWKAVVVVLLGPPVLAVLMFEVVLNASAMFSHANVRLPPRLDALLRRVIVTPDMHRVHHSALRRETDSNYGFNFAFWDRLFSTYVPQPRDGHEAMIIGLDGGQSQGAERLGRSLAIPIRSGPDQ